MDKRLCFAILPSALLVVCMVAACGGGGKGTTPASPDVADGEVQAESPVDLGTGSAVLAYAGSVDELGNSYYQFTTGPSSGVYTISLTNTQSDLSWDLYSGSDYLNSWVYGCDTSVAPGPANEICATPALNPNTTYLISVSEWDAYAGSYDISVTPPAAEGNEQEGPPQEEQGGAGTIPECESCLDDLAPTGGTLSETHLSASPSTGIFLSGFGTAKIDGIMTPGEWATAASVEFQANLPANDGGGTAPATLYVMNDGVNLYIGLKIARPSYGGAINPVLEFDNDNDGVREPGDDVFGMSVGRYSPVAFFDDYRYTCPGAPAGTAGCGPSDTASVAGFPPPGTTDGAAAATNNGQFTYIEMFHPLDSTDDLHDFSLVPGATVGFTLSLRLFSLQTSCNYGSMCYADTGFPACTFCGDSYGDIVIASSDETLPSPPPAEQEILSVVDQQQPVIDSSVGGLAIGGNSEQKLAQIVTAGVTGDLIEVRFPVACSSGELTVEVQGVNGDLPNGSVIASRTVQTADLPSFYPSPPVLRSIAFLQPVTVTAGTRYALVLTSSGACGIFQGPTGNPYSGGNAYYDSRPNAAGVWILMSGNRLDLPFQTVMSADTFPPPVDDSQNPSQTGTESAIPMAVLIDIKPGLDPNSINPENEGTIPVAILSTVSFDASSLIDRSSLTFGRTGKEESRACCNRGLEDVNGDGLPDLMCHFFTQSTGFQAGDANGILKGQTIEGVSIAGNDSVRIVP